MRERIGLMFWGAGLIAVSLYLRSTFPMLDAVRDLANLTLLAGIGTFLYAVVLTLAIPARNW